MGLRISIDKNLEKIMGNYEKEIINNIKKEVKRITPSVENKVLDLVENKLNDFYKISVMQFYNDYSPIYYDRRYSLYNLFRTKREGKKLKYWFEPSEFPSRTKYIGDDGLYATVFKEGWHGGAMHDGVMRYRTGINFSTWGKPAVQSQFSPYDMFIALKEDYEHNGFRKDYKNIWVSSLNSIGINVK